MPDPVNSTFPQGLLSPDDVEIRLDMSKNANLANLVVEDRPEFFDKWDRITPLESEGNFTRNPYRNIEFNAAEAFNYCYRSMARRSVIYLIDAISSNGSEEYRPWSPEPDTEEPFQPPEDLFADIVKSVPLPDTPFRTTEEEEYETIEQLYEDLVACNEILLVENDEPEDNSIITQRTEPIDRRTRYINRKRAKYLDRKRE